MHTCVEPRYLSPCLPNSGPKPQEWCSTQWVSQLINRFKTVPTGPPTVPHSSQVTLDYGRMTMKTSHHTQLVTYVAQWCLHQQQNNISIHSNPDSESGAISLDVILYFLSVCPSLLPHAPNKACF